ncbi:hypothetical protein BJD99_00615 [Rhodococcus sp. 1163]|uniref:hypothetical protein n=1 Tax=Rhodococcus sp. 1163 TaxID=1905289 RepID=UPI000A0037EA|nr:hypothetical protein [Rhodococcus sp. 1163]ORI19829.1 hypothetical protein BJD99_00615 [Rhodococcus sp. 1163]
MTTQRPRAVTVLRWCGLVLLAVIAVFFVARAVAEIATVDPDRPESYEQDWGGPHYLGVVAVHAGPGLLILLSTALWLRRLTHQRKTHHSKK